MGLLVLAAAMPAAAVDEGSPPGIRLTELRRIELPDVRIVSMSPEGSSIVGVRPAVGYRRGELCTFDTATLTERGCASLTGLGNLIRLEDIAWSPDGSRLVFTEHAFRTFLDGDLWLMEAATGALTNLDDDGFEGTLPLFGDDATNATVTVDVSPAFTPDGRSVAFSRSTLREGQRLGNDIAIVPVEGGTPSPIIEVSDGIGIVYLGMRWAPDGSTLYYTHGDPDPEDLRNGIWAVAADGSDAHLLAGMTDQALGAPAVAQVSPLGDQLLAWYPVAAGRMRGSDGLSLIDTTTGAATMLTVDDPGPARAAVQVATFSPDGTALLELTIRTQPDHQVRVRDLATSAVTPLVPEGLETAGPVEYGIMPTWATNGTVLTTGGGDLSHATLLTLEGGLPQP
jgi:hypothetical protein